MAMKKKSPKDNHTEPVKTGNVTNLKLASLPFKSAKAHKEAQDQLRLQVWRRLEEARIFNEMLVLPEFKFWHDEFGKGLTCEFVEENSAILVRVFSKDHGITITINKGLSAVTPTSDTVLGSIVKAMSESFAGTYYGAKGLMTGIKAADLSLKEK